MSSFHSRTLLQATLALSLVVSSLKLVCCDFSIFSALSPAPCLTWYGIHCTKFCEYDLDPTTWVILANIQVSFLSFWSLCRAHRSEQLTDYPGYVRLRHNDVIRRKNDRGEWIPLRTGDSSFSRSRDTIGGVKFKVGHVTLTTPLSFLYSTGLGLDIVIHACKI